MISCDFSNPRMHGGQIVNFNYWLLKRIIFTKKTISNTLFSTESSDSAGDNNQTWNRNKTELVMRMLDSVDSGGGGCRVRSQGPGATWHQVSTVTSVNTDNTVQSWAELSWAELVQPQYF